MKGAIDVMQSHKNDNTCNLEEKMEKEVFGHGFDAFIC